MRWVRVGLAPAALALLAACGGPPVAAPGPLDSWSPSPTPSASPTPSFSPTPWRPPSPSPSPSPRPSPTPKKPRTCGELPSANDPVWYWVEEAVPPATCAQARSVLPAALTKGLTKKYVGKTTFFVQGWRCGWPHNEQDIMTGVLVCTKGSRTLMSEIVHR